eukprot:748366-Hanusia_phi.AAC.3
MLGDAPLADDTSHVNGEELRQADHNLGESSSLLLLLLLHLVLCEDAEVRAEDDLTKTVFGQPVRRAGQPPYTFRYASTPLSFPYYLPPSSLLLPPSLPHRISVGVTGSRKLPTAGDTQVTPSNVCLVHHALEQVFRAPYQSCVLLGQSLLGQPDPVGGRDGNLQPQATGNLFPKVNLHFEGLPVPGDVIHEREQGVVRLRGVQRAPGFREF